MPRVRPFRAVRYDEAKAGPLASLVAPPYDVLDAEARADYLGRSPYNVVHLTLPESEEDAAAKWRVWLAEGALVREEEPVAWVLEQDYVGPDGVARTRSGIVASLHVEPYETRAVLPHERTHREAKEGRLRLVRAVGAQLEPIFLLYDGEPPVAVAAGPPDLEVEGARLWRVPGAELDAFADTQLLIADGHHRYETTVEYAAAGGSPWMMVVLVSTADPGLTIFPTHRLFAQERLLSSNGAGDAAEALRELEARPARPAAAVQVTRGGAALVEGGDELDVQLIDRLGHEGISYTPDADDAVRRVRDGGAAVAYLMRPTRIEDVFEHARRGEVMPPKTTYFFPKLVSGLLFHPLDD